MASRVQLTGRGVAGGAGCGGGRTVLADHESHADEEHLLDPESGVRHHLAYRTQVWG